MEESIKENEPASEAEQAEAIPLSFRICQRILNLIIMFF
jgi:hypothetical protein